MKKKLFLIPLVVIVLLIGGLFINDYLKKKESQNSIIKYDQLITAADSYYASKQFALALKEYTKASDMLPYRPNAYIGIINILMDKKLYDKAEETIPVITSKLTSEEMSAINELMGDRYTQINDWDKAAQYYEKAGDSYKKAKAYILIEEYGKAKEVVKDLEDDDSLIVYALLYAQEQDLAQMSSIMNKSGCQTEDKTPTCNKVNELKNLIDKANENNKEKLYIATLFSKYAYNQGYYALSGHIVKDQINENVEYWESVYLYGISSLATGNSELAIENIEEAINQGCNLAECYLSLARSYRLAGNVEKTSEFYEMAISIDKNTDIAEYIDWLIEQKLYAKAIEFLNAYKTDGDIANFSLLINKIKVQIADENWTEAKNLVDGAETLPSDLEDVLVAQFLRYKGHIHLTILESDGKEPTQDIVDNIDKLGQTVENDAWYYLLLGRLYKLQGDIEKATESLERSIDIDTTGDVSNIARKFM